ncbi:hypothetical protein GCM10007160_31250 [Litchfieldella qijiaojingensis]|uniref:Uncharacterized protein n=1 Tax=Litchfieldella qijiaojingensis TaxID=980347 RepID=A0ABQ2Z3B6_9GAMM|nr:hypothetical protein GCM10007160_31250 [Halomonas qijiaojingensis]
MHQHGAWGVVSMREMVSRKLRFSSNCMKLKGLMDGGQEFATHDVTFSNSCSAHHRRFGGGANGGDGGDVRDTRQGGLTLLAASGPLALRREGHANVYDVSLLWCRLWGAGRP